MNIDNLVRPNIKMLHPFSSARAEYTGVADVYLDANENPHASPYNRYPDPHHLRLRQAIAAKKQVPMDSILLGNGSDEIIDMIIRTFCRPGQDIIRMIYPTFGMYEVSAMINDVRIAHVPLTDQFQLDVERCLEHQTEHDKVLFLCSPNNPTGNNLDPYMLRQVIDNWQGIVVLDEAYIDFSDQASLLVDLNKYSHLIVLQTFSKAWAAAGLRIGMSFAHPSIIGYLNKVKPPYNLGSLTQQKALDILDRDAIVNIQIEDIKRERDDTRQHLEDIQEIQRVYPSDANFLLVKCKDHLLLKGFLQDKGIIVRDRSKLRGCEDCLRITIGTQDENRKLLLEINQFYEFRRQ